MMNKRNEMELNETMMNGISGGIKRQSELERQRELARKDDITSISFDRCGGASEKF